MSVEGGGNLGDPAQAASSKPAAAETAPRPRIRMIFRTPWSQPRGQKSNTTAPRQAAVAKCAQRRQGRALTCPRKLPALAAVKKPNAVKLNSNRGTSRD